MNVYLLVIKQVFPGAAIGEGNINSLIGAGEVNGNNEPLQGAVISVAPTVIDDDAFTYIHAIPLGAPRLIDLGLIEVSNETASD
jgi:hypothetical protein